VQHQASCEGFAKNPVRVVASAPVEDGNSVPFVSVLHTLPLDPREQHLLRPQLKEIPTGKTALAVNGQHINWRKRCRKTIDFMRFVLNDNHWIQVRAVSADRREYPHRFH
jgi:hypothetical protein